MKQPEALELADKLEELLQVYEFKDFTIDLSAAELRRLHEVMAKRIEDLEAAQDCVGWFGYDTGLRLWFETNQGDDGAIPLYKARNAT